MPFSLAGLVGALVGLGVGWLDWRMLSGILRARHVQKSMAMPKDEAGRAEKRLNGILAAIFVLCFIGIPLVGYWTGVAIGG
ncbi:hypothetical protein [Rhodobium gokarnense]|uniref:Uncharacterized protein n=1 Tax=Rhodobium gokarnense TaxID=364296 RepID=A0ABT3HG20_9HYPH|nr:hypothetical protein [Rhodobium gokarnense]MCW2309299.1 hypothetical protein [Rhodobium gokarnense]